jgi:hypothetical protein
MASQKTNTSHHRVLLSFVSSKIHLANLLQKIMASQKNQHIASSRATIICIILQTLCSPNEDFGSPNEHLGTHVRSTFQRNVAQIEHSPFERYFENCVPKRSFGHPKSSFGEHKLVTKDHVIPENQHIACYYHLYHLANLLQKIVASKKTNTS